jgi:membrane protein DedA with SNARE-associated domain
VNGLLVFHFRHLLLHHGYLLLSVYVFAVPLGLPIPADPVLLLMGAMVGNHHYLFVVSLFAKFVPGMSLVAVSLAGIGRMQHWRFLLADAAGCSLWAAAYLLLAGFFIARWIHSFCCWDCSAAGQVW